MQTRRSQAAASIRQAARSIGYLTLALSPGAGSRCEDLQRRRLLCYHLANNTGFGATGGLP